MYGLDFERLKTRAERETGFRALLEISKSVEILHDLRAKRDQYRPLGLSVFHREFWPIHREGPVRPNSIEMMDENPLALSDDELAREALEYYIAHFIANEE